MDLEFVPYNVQTWTDKFLCLKNPMPVVWGVLGNIHKRFEMNFMHIKRSIWSNIYLVEPKSWAKVE